MVYLKEMSICDFESHMVDSEKSESTIRTYIAVLRRFQVWLADRPITKDEVLLFKREYKEKYAPASVNVMIAAINSYLSYIGRVEFCVKNLKIQKRMYAEKSNELTVEEYCRCLEASKSQRIVWLNPVLQTLCSTGIRISELRYITVEAVKLGYAGIDNKGK